MKLDFRRTFEESPPPPDHGVLVHARKPWAILASMGVLIFGALFLLISAFSPLPNSAWPAQSTGLKLESSLSLEPSGDLKTTNIDRVSTSTKPITQNLPDKPNAIETILKASLVEQQEYDNTLIPRLKPTLAKSVEQISTEKLVTLANASLPANVIQDDGLTPSLKPTRRKVIAAQNSTFQSTSPQEYSDIASTNPINLLPISLAPQDENPPPFFSASLTIPTEQTPTTTQTSELIPIGDINSSTEEQVLSLRRGESFVDLLKRAGVRREDRNATALAIGKHLKLRQLQPGLSVELTLAPPNQTWFQTAMTDTITKYLVGLKVRPDNETILDLKRKTNGSYETSQQAVKMTKRLHTVRGQIDGNLYTSMRRQGAPDDIVHSLANVFAFDIDFQRDIFRGDKFEAIYEVWYDDNGNILKGGDILFAELNWRGQSRSKGYYFYNPDETLQQTDYFDTNGQSARRLLMKTPIDGARLSSRFGPRKHPILGYRKTHKGVDFAARRGTPIKATGDGTIERANRYGSFGNYIRIRHANGYKTAYAHLNGFARGIKSGRRVRQGDIIGYVGTTGRSTGPHLHYEVHHHGKAVNPQKLKIATGIKLSGTKLDSFLERRNMLDRLRTPPLHIAQPASSVSTSSTITGK